MFLAVRLRAGPCYFRYILASAISLTADMVAFVMSIGLDMAAVPSAVIGYVCGLVVHWIVSSRFVFPWAARAARHETARKQFLFIVSALVGLGITTGVVHWGTRWGFDPRVAKIFAICTSFQVTYVMRRRVVFS